MGWYHGYDAITKPIFIIKANWFGIGSFLTTIIILILTTILTITIILNTNLTTNLTPNLTTNLKLNLNGKTNMVN